MSERVWRGHGIWGDDDSYWAHVTGERQYAVQEAIVTLPAADYDALKQRLADAEGLLEKVNTGYQYCEEGGFMYDEIAAFLNQKERDDDQR